MSVRKLLVLVISLLFTGHNLVAQQERKKIEVTPEYQSLNMSLSLGVGITQTVMNRHLSHPAQNLSGKVGRAVPLGIGIGYRFTPHIGIATGLRNVLQTFKVEANYPNHRYTSSVGGFVTQIPVSIHVRSPISEKVTLMGRSGFTYNFYNGAESYSGRTATASTQTWSVDKHMDVLTTLSAGYFGEFGVILPRVTPGAELQWAISYHGIPQSVMEGELVHTSETGKVEDYYYHAQGNYMALEVSYHYNLKTGLKAEKEHMPAHQSVYLEIGGAGGFYSVNYDHIFFNKRFFKGGARLGLEFIPQSVASDLPDVGVPLSLNGLLFETHDHHIEVGLGQTITTSNSIDVSVTKATYKRQLTLSATSFIGYRYQQNQGGFLFRGGYSPLWINYDQVNHWLGISFGTSF